MDVVDYIPLIVSSVGIKRLCYISRPILDQSIFVNGQKGLVYSQLSTTSFSIPLSLALHPLSIAFFSNQELAQVYPILGTKTLFFDITSTY